MNPNRLARDPRLLLLGGVVVLVLGAFLGRVLVGPGPATGARINRGLVHAQEGRPAVAFRELEAVLAERPHDADAWMRAGRAVVALDRPTEAAVYFHRAAEIDTTSLLAPLLLGRALLDAGQIDLADAAFAQVLERKPDHAKALFHRAAIAGSRGDVERALAFYQLGMGAPWSDPQTFRGHRLFDPIRNDPRFVGFVTRRLVPQPVFRETDT